MDDLETFRDHARRLSESAHRDDCDRIHRIVKVDRWLGDLQVTLSCPDTDGHEPHDWVGASGVDWTCPGLCVSCSTDRDRALWTQLADEIDRHIAALADEPLWGGDS